MKRSRKTVAAIVTLAVLVAVTPFALANKKLKQLKRNTNELTISEKAKIAAAINTTLRGH